MRRKKRKLAKDYLLVCVLFAKERERVFKQKITTVRERWVIKPIAQPSFKVKVAPPWLRTFASSFLEKRVRQFTNAARNGTLVSKISSDRNVSRLKISYYRYFSSALFFHNRFPGPALDVSISQIAG